jgi:3-mercaptopyruvate sulfurtransferase SseA
MKQPLRAILFLTVLLLAAGTLGGCLSQQNYITYEELKALLDDSAAMETTTIVDVRPAAAWKSGYIPESINIEYDTVINSLGGLKDGGAALTSIVTNKDGTLVIYGTGDDHTSLFAAQAMQLGYLDVKFYQGGMADWRESHGDYLYITYDGFRQWYDAKCPFADGENYLVDSHPPSLYTGYGHIPGAINIMSKHFASLDPDSLKPITDSISNRGATIVFYCVGVT